MEVKWISWIFLNISDWKQKLDTCSGQSFLVSWVGYNPKIKHLGGILLMFLGKRKQFLMVYSILNTVQILIENVCLSYIIIFLKIWFTV